MSARVQLNRACVAQPESDLWPLPLTLATLNSQLSTFFPLLGYFLDLLVDYLAGKPVDRQMRSRCNSFASIGAIRGANRFALVKMPMIWEYGCR